LHHDEGAHGQDDSDDRIVRVMLVVEGVERLGRYVGGQGEEGQRDEPEGQVLSALRNVPELPKHHQRGHELDDRVEAKTHQGDGACGDPREEPDHGLDRDGPEGQVFEAHGAAATVGHQRTLDFLCRSSTICAGTTCCAKPRIDVPG
jgi:hypothetical protein